LIRLRLCLDCLDRHAANPPLPDKDEKQEAKRDEKEEAAGHRMRWAPVGPARGRRPALHKLEWVRVPLAARRCQGPEDPTLRVP